MSYKATDNADGSGLTVTVTGEDPAGTYTAQIRDATQENWRDAGFVVGNGQIVVPTGKLDSEISFSRVYWVRVHYTLPGVGTSTPELVTVTRGLPSDVFSLIVELQHELITLNLSEIAGRVVRCIDPNGAGTGMVDHPALWVFQSEPFGTAAQDNQTSVAKVAIEVGISDRNDGDYIDRLEWWAYVAHRIFWHYNRTQPHGAPMANAGRRWDVTQTFVRPDDPRKYQFRYQSFVFRTECERAIGG